VNKIKTILLDSSSAILLHKINLLTAITNLYSAIISQTVFDELTSNSSIGSSHINNLCKTEKIIVKDSSELSSIEKKEITTKLDSGEKSLIELYVSGCGDFIILDDKKGALCCKKLNIPFINSLLVIKILLFKNYIITDEYQNLKKHLLRIARYSKFVIKYESNCTIEDLEFFI